MRGAAADLGSGKIEQLRGGDACYNAQVARALFAGELSGPIRDTVALNAAAGVVAYRASQTGNSPQGDLSKRLRSALDEVEAVIEAGIPAQALSRWVATSQSESQEA